MPVIIWCVIQIKLYLVEVGPCQLHTQTFDSVVLGISILA